jgi:hypothetical protein
MKYPLAVAVATVAIALLGISSLVGAQGPISQSASAQASAGTAAQSAPAQAAPAAPVPEKSGWDVVVYPLLAYIPLAGIDVTLPPSEPCTGCPPSVPSGSESGLSGAWFASFRVEKGRFALAGDFNYAGLSAERSTPVFDVGVDVLAGAATVGFKIVEGLYAEAGARYYELDVTAKILSFPEVSWKPSTFQPLIGTTYRPQVGKHFRVYSHLDYTGWGGDASTVNGNARLEWRPVTHFALTAGYGFSTLRVNGEIGRKPISLKYTLHGPILGFGIPF